jgi:peptidoglycan/LPS O-acetylase OafA/YrhL
MALQAETLEPRGSKINSVEFWRIIFTVLVCLYHFEMFFMAQGKMLSSGSSAVEFFFIIAGFFMARSSKRDLSRRQAPMSTKEAHSVAVDFVVKKLKAIMPVVAIVLVLGVLVYPTFPSAFADRLHNLMNSEWEFLLMVGTPFGYNNGATPIVPMWFLTALIVVGYIYTFLIYRWHDFMMFAAPAIGILFYVFFTLNSSLTLDFYIQMGFLNAGFVKAIAEMSFGVTVFLLYDYLSKKNFGTAAKIILTLIELYAIYRFFALTLWQPLGMDNFRRVPYIMIIVGLSFLNKSFFSQLVNRKFWKPLANISLTMYLCHFHLINVYMSAIGSFKMNLAMKQFTSASAKEALEFMSNMGGFDSNYRPIGMSWKDAIAFLILVIAVSTAITLYIKFIKHLIIKPIKQMIEERKAEKAAAAAAPKWY